MSSEPPPVEGELPQAERAERALAAPAAAGGRAAAAWRTVLVYVAGVAAVILSVSLRVLLVPVLGSDVRYLLLYPAVVGVALAFGTRVALVGAAAGVLVSEIRMPAQHGGGVAEGIRTLAVLATAALAGLVAGRLREMQARAVEQAGRAHAARLEAERAAASAAVNQERYRSLFLKMGEGFAVHELVFDAQGEPCDYRFLEVNPAFEALTGLSRDAVVGRLKSEVLPDDDPHWLRVYAQVARTGTPVSFESRSAALERVYEVYASCPAPNQFTTLFREVTARRKMERALRESEQHHRLLFETMTQGVVYQARDGSILSMNPAAERILGQTPSTFVGKTSVTQGDLTIREDGSPFPGLDHPAMVALRTGRTLDGVVMGVLNPRDGALHWIEVSAVPLFREGEDKPYQVYTLFADVTERKQAENALKLSEQRHRELAEELREADRRKSDFLAVLSHELRNPLAPVRNSLFVLGRVEPGSEQARRAQEVIARQVNQLTHLVDDLLDLTRVSRGRVQLRLEAVDLVSVLLQTVEDHRRVYERAGIELLTEFGPQSAWVRADATRVAQIVGNLLGNAVKFTPAGGRVTLCLQATDAEARIEVRDTGVGMDESVLARLFEPFAQAQQTLERAQGGLGIGLTLVKAFAEMQGGRVQAESEGPGRGTTFTLTLPIVPAPQARSSPRPAVDGTARRVLVVEDRDDAAESLCLALRLMGHNVERAASGREALERAREFRPEVVVCDVGLPQMDGYEVARRMRADPLLCAARLVAVTGYALAEDREKARAAGFEHHLAKPPDLEALRRIVAEPFAAVPGNDAASREHEPPADPAAPQHGDAPPEGTPSDGTPAGQGISKTPQTPPR